MKIVIPGGAGQVGTILARAFHASGHEVIVLSRNPAPAPWRTIGWDAETLGDWAATLDGADAVINLAGHNVNCRYTPENRRLIKASRVNATLIVGEAIARAGGPPRVWLQASTATIYAHRYDAPNDEAAGIIGGGEPDAPAKWRFSIEVATAWEQAALEAKTPHTRKVLMRADCWMRGFLFNFPRGRMRRGIYAVDGAWQAETQARCHPIYSRCKQMKKIGRNDACPCGSGRKYKNCCGAEQQPDLEGLPEGIRMKGGIRYDPAAGGYLVIVHIWDNVECRGEPEEWNYPQVFRTEDEAMAYYKTAIGPALKRRLERASRERRMLLFITGNWNRR